MSDTSTKAFPFIKLNKKSFSGSFKFGSLNVPGNFLIRVSIMLSSPPPPLRLPPSSRRTDSPHQSCSTLLLAFVGKYLSLHCRMLCTLAFTPFKYVSLSDMS